MYQALYRKYRPTKLSDVAGQDVVVKTLTNAVINKKLSHAYLFSGPRGTGKTSIAKIIGKMANCSELVNGEPCNNCVNCTQINNNESVDLIEIDAASNNGVDEIRELKSKVNLVPNTGKYKIYIIDEVHMLTVGAFNALLKTLEEPPSHIIFILATTEPHKIPATILSRCQRYDFKKIDIESIVKRLKYIIEKELINVEDGVLDEIARLSDGGMRDSISLLDQAVSFSDDTITINDIHNMNGTVSQNDLKEFIEDVLTLNYSNIFTKIDNFNDNGKNLIKLTDEIIYFLRNVLLHKIVPSHFSKTDSNIYNNIGTKTNKAELIDMIEKLNDSTNKMRISSNPKIILETTIISLLKEENNIIESSINNNNNNNNIVKNDVKQENLNKEKNDNNSINIEEKIISEKIIKTDENPLLLNKKNNSKKEELLTKFEEIRINNTLAKFNKKELMKLNENFDTIKNFAIDNEYGEIVSLLLEGKIRAASENNLVMVFEEEWLKNKFNDSILIIETLFDKIYRKKYKVIATNITKWEIYKKEFNNKLKTFVYIEEPNIEDILKLEEEKTEIENIFDNIVEYK